MLNQAIVRVKWNTLRRSKTFLLLMTFNYLILSIMDTDNLLFLEGLEQHIYRYTYQQFYIVISSIFLVNIVFNHKSLDVIKNFMVIYVEDVRQEIYSTFWVLATSSIIIFTIGQFVMMIVNYIFMGELYLSLFIVNLVIVSAQIVTIIMIVMSLRLLFVKDVLVYRLFFVTIFVSLAVNNVLITIPLTIRILGINEQGYYVTYGMQLWLGRGILLSAAYIMLRLGVKKFSTQLQRD